MPVDPSDIIPESIQLVISAFDLGDPAYTRRDPKGKEFPAGFSIPELRRRFGGESGTFRDPLGQDHPVSLAPWRDADPDMKHLHIAFRFKQRSMIGKTNPHRDN